MVELQDKSGHVTTVTQPFSLDTEPSSLGLFELLLLQANLPMGVSSHNFVIIYMLNISSSVEVTVYVAVVTIYWTTTAHQAARTR